MSKWIQEVESRNALLYFLETNLSMSNPAAGEDGEVQFNGDGVLDADSKFKWDGDREIAVGHQPPIGDVLITGPYKRFHDAHGWRGIPLCWRRSDYGFRWYRNICSRSVS